MDEKQLTEVKLYENNRKTPDPDFQLNRLSY